MEGKDVATLVVVLTLYGLLCIGIGVSIRNIINELVYGMGSSK